MSKKKEKRENRIFEHLKQSKSALQKQILILLNIQKNAVHDNSIYSIYIKFLLYTIYIKRIQKRNENCTDSFL